jgi:GTP 3',8-cyclase
VLADSGLADSGLADSYGRVATDLRVSLTDRCNLRCAYCMPAEGLDWLPRPELLTDDEVIRLITVAVTRLGVREVRFTGGEPLLRRGLTAIVARARDQPPRISPALPADVSDRRLAGAPAQKIMPTLAGRSDRGSWDAYPRKSF